MSNTILKTDRHIDHAELYQIVEKAYGLGRHDFRIEYPAGQTPEIHIETYMDKGAGLSVEITDGGMKASISLFPPVNSGSGLDNETVEEYLLDEKGLDADLINWDRLKECFAMYNAGQIVYKVNIAEGLPKVDGRDARYALHFEPPEKTPKVLEDGSVDFKAFNNIVMVNEEDKLLTYMPETPGVNGRRVTGEVIYAVKGKKIVIHKGNGVIFDPETNIYSSAISGHVTFNSNRLNVNPVYAVQGDVDYSVGNIEFHGTVTVSGDVLSGFSIKAKNISIWGVARDAHLEAEEDITVRTGIFSTGKGITKAGNNVTATFIEGAAVYAGLAVYIKDYCFNSKVYSEGEITVLSGDGAINGGELYAFSSIEAKRIGRENSSAFTLRVGVKHFLNDRIDELIDQKERIEHTLKETDKTIRALAKANPDIKKKQQLKSIIANRSGLYSKYDGIDKEIENLIQESMHPMPYILAKNEIHEGVRVVIYNTEHIVPERAAGAKFIFHHGTGKVTMVRPDAKLEYDPKKKRKSDV